MIKICWRCSMSYVRPLFSRKLPVTLLLGSSLLNISTTPVHGLDGAYAGIYGGLMNENVSVRYTNDVGSGRVKTRKYGALTGAFAGYLFELGSSRTLLGFETHITVTPTTYNADFGVDGVPAYGTSKNNRTNSAGAALVLAKLFNVRTLLFLKAGAERIDYTIKLNYNNNLTTPAFFRGKSTSVKFLLTGPFFGVGLDYAVIRQVALGAEYIFAGTFKRKKKEIDPGHPQDTLLFKPIEHKIMFRASYRFG